MQECDGKLCMNKTGDTQTQWYLVVTHDQEIICRKCKKDITSGYWCPIHKGIMCHNCAENNDYIVCYNKCSGLGHLNHNNISYIEKEKLEEE